MLTKRPKIYCMHKPQLNRLYTHKFIKINDAIIFHTIMLTITIQYYKLTTAGHLKQHA